MRKLFLLPAAFILTCALVFSQQAPPPPTPAAMQDIANKIADAINKQDAAALQKMAAPDAVYLDEDGHQPPVAAWITKLTTGTPAKKIEISAIRGQTWDNSGWVSFNYTLTENFKDKPVALKGIASFVVKKPAGADWQITLIHGALEQHVAGMTQ
jgi:hypothetical protein